MLSHMGSYLILVETLMLSRTSGKFILCQTRTPRTARHICSFLVQSKVMYQLSRGGCSAETKDTRHYFKKTFIWCYQARPIWYHSIITWFITFVSNVGNIPSIQAYKICLQEFQWTLGKVVYYPASSGYQYYP